MTVAGILVALAASVANAFAVVLHRTRCPW
jgi:hypothetical protein